MIKSYFNATADKVKLYTGETDSYNEPILEEIETEVPCRFIEESKVIKTAQAEEIVTTAEIWLEPHIQRLKQRSTILINGTTYKVEKSGFVYGLKEKKYQRLFVT